MVWLLTFLFFLLAVLGLAAGVIMGREPLRGSCGGSGCGSCGSRCSKAERSARATDAGSQ